jgi:hypothetical protein
MPQLNFNPSMINTDHFGQGFAPNYMTNNPGTYGQQPNPMSNRNIVSSQRNLNNFQNPNLGRQRLESINFHSTTNFATTFGGPGSPFMGNQTTRYPPDYFKQGDNSKANSIKKNIKSKSQKRKLMKKGSKRGKGGKTKNQALNSLEIKFGAFLNQLKNDEAIDMNMENANMSDLEVRALGSILSHNKKLRKISLKRNKITDRGVRYLCDSLASSNLEFLDLSYNKISPKSFGEFKKYKKKNNKIRCIVLRNNDIPSSIKRKKIVEFQKIGLNFDF